VTAWKRQEAGTLMVKDAKKSRKNKKLTARSKRLHPSDGITQCFRMEE